MTTFRPCGVVGLFVALLFAVALPPQAAFILNPLNCAGLCDAVITMPPPPPVMTTTLSFKPFMTVFTPHPTAQNYTISDAKNVDNSNSLSLYLADDLLKS